LSKALDIHIVGGGPAGLYLAYLLKCHNHTDRVQVTEQNPADTTYGWGVVFSDRALNFIRQRTPSVYDSIGRCLEHWSDLTIVHQGQAIRIDGSQFSGVSRQYLLSTLQHYCETVGVEMQFSTPLSSLPANNSADLIIGADGINSIVRSTYASQFETSRQLCSNYFVWYGTRRVFETLSLIFKANRDGAFVAHTYRYSPQMSTFLVECDAQTFENSGLGQMTDSESRAYCEHLFSADLGGEGLRSNHSIWRQFPVIKNRHWFQNNVVLIGDALRTVHFSIGSGTRTAMQDAIVLADSITGNRNDLTAALQRFVENRRADGEKIERLAGESIRWYEDFHRHMRLSPYDFAMNYMLRGGKLDLAALKTRAPHFARHWQTYASDPPR